MSKYRREAGEKITPTNMTTRRPDVERCTNSSAESEIYRIIHWSPENKGKWNESIEIYTIRKLHMVVQQQQPTVRSKSYSRKENAPQVRIKAV